MNKKVKIKVIHEITTCHLCPFYFNTTRTVSEYCKHPSLLKKGRGRKFYEEDDEDKIPEWCPEIELAKSFVVMKIPKDDILADFLEELGFLNEAETLRK